MGRGFVSEQTRTLFFCETLSLGPDPTALKPGFPRSSSLPATGSCAFLSPSLQIYTLSDTTSATGQSAAQDT